VSERRGSLRNDARDLTFHDYLAIAVYSLGMFGFGLILTVEKYLDLPERMLTVPYRLLILLCSLLLIGTLLVKGGRILFRMYQIPFGIFWTLYTIRFVYDAYIRDMPMAMTTYDDLLFYIFGMCFIPMVAMLLYDNLRVMASAITASLAVLGGTCMAILLVSRDLLYSDFGRLRVEGGLNQITLGHLGVSLVVLCLFLLFAHKPILRVPRFILAALIVLGLLVVGLASSRGPVLALVVLFPLLIFFAIRQGTRLRTVGVVVIVAIGIPLGASAVKGLGSNIEERILATAGQAESGSESRLDLWQSAWEDFANYPLIGRALEGRYEMYPHNLILESFMATGLLGGVAFVWLLLAGLRAALSLIANSTDQAWLGFLYIQMTVYGFFSGALWSHFGFWYMLAAVLAYGSGACVARFPQVERSKAISSAVRARFLGSRN